MHMRDTCTMSVEFQHLGKTFYHETLRSLQLLTAIGQTIDNLTMVCRLFEVAADRANQLVAEVNRRPDLGEIDESRLIPVFEKTQDRLAVLHKSLTLGKASAETDYDLCDEDGVSHAYDGAIRATYRLNESIEALRWSILEHNADVVNKPDNEPKQLLTSESDIDTYLGRL